VQGAKVSRRLTSLNPRWCASPHNGPDAYQLIFDCPLCGRDTSVFFETNSNPQRPGVWKGSFTLNPTPFETLTLTPSIGEPYHGRVRCTWHGNITNGEVTP